MWFVAVAVPMTPGARGHRHQLACVAALCGIQLTLGRHDVFEAVALDEQLALALLVRNDGTHGRLDALDDDLGQRTLEQLELVVHLRLVLDVDADAVLRRNDNDALAGRGSGGVA